MESIVSLILQLLILILFLCIFLLLSFSVYILYLRRIKFGHIPGPPASSFFKGMLKHCLTLTKVLPRIAPL